MSKKLHVATSPLTNRIYAGSILKDGQTWAANKTDVTGEACAAVSMHVIANGEPVVVTANGVPKWEITVREGVDGYKAPQPAGGEAVAWRTRHRDVDWSFTTRPHPRDLAAGIWEPLYTHPPAAEVREVDRG